MPFGVVDLGRDFILGDERRFREAAVTCAGCIFVVFGGSRQGLRISAMAE